MRADLLFARKASRWALVVLGLVWSGSCADTRLEFPQEEIVDNVVDNELTLTGSYCTSPAADVAYPVKVMFLVDGSGSQQFSDQNRQRVVAVEETVNSLLGTANTYFKIVVFNATISATPTNIGDPPPPVFTNDVSELVMALANLAEADTLTDYQGVLAVAYSELLRDMQEVTEDPTRGPAELSRTKYVVILISDGLPDPQCQAGLGNDFDPNFDDNINPLCENQDYIYCLMELDCSERDTDFCLEQFGTTTMPRTTCSNGVCDFDGTRCYQTKDSNSFLGGLASSELAAGQDYNQAYQILANVEDIMELQERFQVGEIRIHSGLVLDPEADPAVIEIFGDATQAIPLMEQVREIGQGKFMQFYGGDQIDFLQINFDSIKQPRVVRGFFADNVGARRDASGLGADTDFDGLTDAQEIDLGSDLRSADTDGDGYSDYMEWRRRAFSFDAKDPCLPPVIDVPGADPLTPCDPAAPLGCEFAWGTHPETGATIRLYLDSDRDGLHDCEEKQLGTDPRNPDTDRDGLPDRSDYLAGLDPLQWDYDRDDDQDGVPNGREVEWHLNPVVQQGDRELRDRYRYDRPEVATTIDGRPCFDFTVRRVQLAATKENDDLRLTGVGFNDVRLYILENMADDLGGVPLVRTACLRAQYIPPSLKVPANGVVPLSEGDFKFLPGSDPIFNDPTVRQNIFDPASDCVVLQ